MYDVLSLWVVTIEFWIVYEYEQIERGSSADRNKRRQVRMKKANDTEYIIDNRYDKWVYWLFGE